MGHVQLQIEAEGANWRQKYDERMERLKTRKFPIQDSASQQGMLQQNLSGEEEIMNFDLYKAVENGNVDRFVDMLEQVSAENKLSLSAIFDQVIPSGDSILHVAANMGKDHIAELILYHFPELLNKRNVRGDTALHVAAKSKSCGVIQVILTQYANDKSMYGLENELTRLTNECGDTALHEAVYTGHLDVVTDLFRADGPVGHYLNKSGKSPLYLAVETGNEKILGLLLQTPFPENELPRCRGNSPLHAAILEKKPALLKYILARRPELISLRCVCGGTALHYAAYRGYVEGVRILLNLSALTGIERDSKGRLPIHVACKRGHVMVVKELLQQEWPSPKICLDQKGQNILHVAAKNGKANVVSYLLGNKKIDQFTINEKDKNGDTPLHLASKNLFPKVLLVMTGDKRVDLNCVNGEGLTALAIVLSRGTFHSSSRKLLSYGTLRSSGASFKSGCTFNPLSRQSTHTDRTYTQGTANVFLLVNTLLVTLAFGAGFSVPGGVYSSDDPNPHNRGMAVLADKALFKVFSAFNVIAMYCSAIGSIILLWERHGDVRVAQAAIGYAVSFMSLGLLAMAVAFMAAVRLTVNNDSLLANVITALAIIFLSIIISIAVLAYFPVGRPSCPLLRQGSRFFVWISCILCRYEDKPKYLDIQEANKDTDKDKGNKDTDKDK